jgi:hypothetical protein
MNTPNAARPDLALQEESERARFGSLTGALITAAACPVVAVPPGGASVGGAPMVSTALPSGH